jgi:hypothetical protein
VVIDEYNHDILGKSFYFVASNKRGAFSPAFTTHVFDHFYALASNNKVRTVSRNT